MLRHNFHFLFSTENSLLTGMILDEKYLPVVKDIILEY